MHGALEPPQTAQGFHRTDCRAQVAAVDTPPGVSKNPMPLKILKTSANMSLSRLQHIRDGQHGARRLVNMRMSRAWVAMRGHGAGVQMPCRGRSFDLSWHGPMVSISGIGGMQRLQQQPAAPAAQACQGLRRGCGLPRGPRRRSARAWPWTAVWLPALLPLTARRRGCSRRRASRRSGFAEPPQDCPRRGRRPACPAVANTSGDSWLSGWIQRQKTGDVGSALTQTGTLAPECCACASQCMAHHRAVSLGTISPAAALARTTATVSGSSFQPGGMTSCKPEPTGQHPQVSGPVQAFP